MKLAQIFLTVLFIATSLLPMPAVTFAQAADPLVSQDCGIELYGPNDPEVKRKVDPAPIGSVKNPCGWNELIKLVGRVANYLIILGAAVAALAFGYAGLLMLTAQGEMGKIEEAKAIFGKVLVGFLWMLAAWLIVHAIEAGLVVNKTDFKSLLTPTTP